MAGYLQKKGIVIIHDPSECPAMMNASNASSKRKANEDAAPMYVLSNNKDEESIKPSPISGPPSFRRGYILENLPPKLLLWLLRLHPQRISVCANLVLQTHNDAGRKFLLF